MSQNGQTHFKHVRFEDLYCGEKYQKTNQFLLFLFYLFIIIKHNQTKHTYMFQPNIPTCIKKYWGFKLVPFLFVHLFRQTTAQEAK